MALFATISILDLAYIICHFFWTILIFISFFLRFWLFKFNCIDLNNENRAFWGLLILSILLVFFFPRFFDSISLLILLELNFLRSNLRFFSLKIFYSLNLGLNNVHWLIASMTMLIYILANGSLYFGLGFGPNCLFD